MNEAAVSWQIEGWGANLKCGPLEAYACSGADGMDLIVSRWNNRPAEGIAVLCSGGPGEGPGRFDVADRFIRGRDFVASCNAAGKDRVTPHVYWRAAFDDLHSAARVELVLSAQTELLDSVPTWSFTSFVLGATRLHIPDLGQPRFDDISSASRTFDSSGSTTHLFLFRIASLGLSYAQMVHPSDFVAAHAPFDGNQPLLLESTLFPEHLEKGVIRRGRICGWFMPIENDVETAVTLARQFVDEPLPLTA